MTFLHDSKSKYLVLALFSVILGVFGWYFFFPPTVSSPEEIQDNQIVMEFSVPMNKSSVEKSIVTQPKVEGSFQWDSPSRVIFRPTPEYSDEPFTITLGSDARDKFGRKVLSSFSSYFTPDAARQAKLSFVVPEDTSDEVGLMQPVTLLWDGPAFPLANPEKTQLLLEQSITVEPEAPAGSWQILGTSGILFEPLDPWKGSTQYAITIPETITGEKIQLEFDTQRINVTAIYTKEPQDLNEYDPVVIDFSQPVSAQDVSDFIVLTDRDENVLEFKTQQGTKTVYDEDQNESEAPDNTRIELIPTKPWPKENEIIVTIREGLTGTEGPLGTRADKTQNIKTLQPLSVSFDNIPAYIYENLSVEFSNPVSASVFLDAITIDGADVTPENFEEYKTLLREEQYPEESRYFALPPINNQWFAGEPYTITFAQINDIFGQSVYADESKEIKFTVQYGQTVDPLFFPMYGDPKVYNPETDLNFALFYAGQWRDVEITLTNQETQNTIDTLTQTLNKDTTKKHLLELPMKELFGAKLYDGENITPGFYKLEVQFNKTEEKDRYPRKYITEFFVPEFVIEGKFLANDEAYLIPRAFPSSELKPYQPEGPYQVQKWKKYWDDQTFEKEETIPELELGTQSFKPGSQSNYLKVIDANKKIGYISRNMDQTMSVYDAPNLNYSPWFYEDTLRGAVFTERPLYKPGQTVYMKAILRQIEGFEKTFPLENIDITEYESMKFVVKDPFWDEIANVELTNIQSSADASFTLPVDAVLGNYNVSIQAYKKNEEYPTSFDGTFYVTQYRKPKFLIRSHFENEYAIDQETLSFSSESQYTFGGAIKEKPVLYTISLFGEKCEGDWFWWCESRDRVITRGQGFTDENGGFDLNTQINLADIIEENDADVQWTLINATITVEEAPDERLAKTISIPFSSSAGVITDLKTNRYYSQPNENVTVSGKLTDLADEPIENEVIKLEIIHNRWARTDRKDSGGVFRGEWQMIEEVIDTQVVTTINDGTFEKEIQTPEKSGDYTIRALYTDKKDRTTQADRSLWIWGDSDSPEIKINDQNNILKLLPEKTSYNIGETVNILVPITEFEITNAHATLERGTILSEANFDAQTQTLSFKAEPWMSPNITASLLLEGLNDEKQPMVYWGAAHIEVTDPVREITVSAKAEKENYEPGDEVTILVETKNNDNGIPAEVTISVVDASLLALKSRPSLDLKSKFFSDGFLPLGVQTTHTLANYVSPAIMEQVQDQIADVMAMAESKMGGGGKAGEQQPRGDFRDTAHFAANVMTDENGQGRVTFKLPDNTTTWNVWAVANTQAQQFGESESEFKATHPLVVSPIVPNVFQTGDELEIGVLIAKNTETKENVTVEITLPESITTNTAIRSINVEETGRVFFPVKVSDAINEKEIAQITFSAKTEEHEDSVKISREILPPLTVRFIADMFRVDEDRTTKVISDERALSSNVTVHASSSLLQSSDAIISNLETRNYGCTEQQFSYWTALMLENQIFGRNLATLPKDQMTESWEYIIGNLEQNSGFKFWNDPRSEPNVWLTANILEFSELWESQGFELTEAQKKWTLDFIDRRSQEICVQFAPCLDNTTRLYAQYVLAKHKRLTGSQLELMHEYATTLEGKIWWLMAMDELQNSGRASEIGNNKQYAQEIHSEIQRQVRSRDRSLFLTEAKGRSGSFYHQDERLTAIFMELALMEDSLISDPTKVASYLSQANAYGHSTNTSMRVLNAFKRYAQRYEKNTENIAFALEIKGTEDQSLEGTIKNRDIPYTTTITAIPGSITQITAKEKASDYYTAIELSESFRAQDTTSVSKGFWIEREFFDINDTAFENPITEMIAGQNYLARVKIITNTNHRQVALKDHIPSGAEFVQFDLDGSDQSLSDLVDTENKNGYFGRLSGCNGLCPVFPTHKEFDTNQARFFMDYLPAGAHEIKYVINARLSGSFDVLPPHIEQMYNPEVFASGEGSTMTIKR